MLYTFAFMGAYIGLYLNSHANKPKSIFIPSEMLRLQIRLLPCWPLMLLSELKLVEWPYSLVVKYLAPPFLMNLYLFGYSDKLIT
jgi:hypothetical protein